MVGIWLHLSQRCCKEHVHDQVPRFVLLYTNMCSGLQVMHNTDAVVAALSFFGQLDRHRQMSISRMAPPVPAHASPVSPPDPTQPQTLSQRAKQAFALHNLPIRRKLAIPLTSIRLSCPGSLHRQLWAVSCLTTPARSLSVLHAGMKFVRESCENNSRVLVGSCNFWYFVVSAEGHRDEVSLVCAGIVGVIQYHHSVNGPGGPKKEASSGAAAQPAPGSEYELVAAVSGIRAQVYGEDFQDFMHHGATQRSSVHAYMDLFCYQAPASRCITLKNNPDS